MGASSDRLFGVRIDGEQVSKRDIWLYAAAPWDVSGHLAPALVNSPLSNP